LIKAFKQNPLYTTLSKEHKILLEVYSNGRAGIHLCGLARVLKSEMSKVTVINKLEELSNLQFVKADWKNIESKSRGFKKKLWVRSYEIGEDMLFYVQKLHEAMCMS
jgi:hypothetical protein